MMPRQKALELEIRRKIYEFIAEKPGLHLREISRSMKIPKTTLTYHINYLEKSNLINQKHSNGCNRLFINEKIGRKEQQLLNILRQKIPRRIFLYLLFSLSFSQLECSKELNVHPATISYHLDKMIEAGLLEKTSENKGLVNLKIKNWSLKRQQEGREVFYRRKDQEILNITYKLLITHKNSIPDKELVESYIFYLEEVENYKNKKTLENTGKAMDSVIDFVEDLFKPPFVY